MSALLSLDPRVGPWYQKPAIRHGKPSEVRHVPSTYDPVDQCGRRRRADLVRIALALRSGARARGRSTALLLSRAAARRWSARPERHLAGVRHRELESRRP